MCQVTQRNVDAILQQSQMQTRQVTMALDVMQDTMTRYFGRNTKAQADEEEEISGIESEDEDLRPARKPKRNQRRIRPARKPIDVTDFHVSSFSFSLERLMTLCNFKAALRDHVHALLDWSPSSEQPFPPIPNPHAEYMVKFNNGENEGCIADEFWVDVSKTPGAAWNQSAANVFADDFLAHYNGPQTYDEVRTQFLTWLSGHRKNWLNWRKDPSSEARSQQRSDKASQTRKRNVSKFLFTAQYDRRLTPTSPR